MCVCVCVCVCVYGCVCMGVCVQFVCACPRSCVCLHEQAIVVGSVRILNFFVVPGSFHCASRFFDHCFIDPDLLYHFLLFCVNTFWTQKAHNFGWPLLIQTVDDHP